MNVRNIQLPINIPLINKERVKNHTRQSIPPSIEVTPELFEAIGLLNFFAQHNTDKLSIVNTTTQPTSPPLTPPTPATTHPSPPILTNNTSPPPLQPTPATPLPPPLTEETSPILQNPPPMLTEETSPIRETEETYPNLPSPNSTQPPPPPPNNTSPYVPIINTLPPTPSPTPSPQETD